MKNKFLYILILLMIAGCLPAQFLANPSFEGTTGQGLAPAGWVPGATHSSPDTEPFDAAGLQASDGATFVTLVSRGSTSEYPNTFEDFRTELSAPLEAGNCYDLSIDLATRSDLAMCTVNGYFEYTETPGLTIFGSATGSSKGSLVAFSGEVLNTDAWQTYYFRVNPDSDISYLTLEIELAERQYGFGNIALDNFNIEQVKNDSAIRMNAEFSKEELPIDLTASAGESYSWDPVEGLSCTDCQAPKLTDNISGTFACTILDSYGCPSTELFIIDFIEDPADELVIPNVFTPNNDGINDYFEIIGLPSFSSLLIFDTNGKQVYISDTYGNDWDGRDMDQIQLPEGTYWYVLVLPGFGGKKKGYVYLKRE